MLTLTCSWKVPLGVEKLTTGATGPGMSVVSVVSGAVALVVGRGTLVSAGTGMVGVTGAIGFTPGMGDVGATDGPGWGGLAPEGTGTLGSCTPELVAGGTSVCESGVEGAAEHAARLGARTNKDEKRFGRRFTSLL